MGRDAVVVEHRDVQAREVLRLESDGVLVVLAPPGVVRLHVLQPLPRRGPVTVILSAHNNTEH